MRSRPLGAGGKGTGGYGAALAVHALPPASARGRAWVLREEDVLERVAVHPRAGRPSAASRFARGSAHREPTEAGAPHGLYRECRALFSHVPTAAMMAQAQSQEEAAFYMAVSDFFLQQRQAQLVKEGVF